jgi:hypothetical protein
METVDQQDPPKQGNLKRTKPTGPPPQSISNYHKIREYSNTSKDDTFDEYEEFDIRSVNYRRSPNQHPRFNDQSENNISHVINKQLMVQDLISVLVALSNNYHKMRKYTNTSEDDTFDGQSPYNNPEVLQMFSNKFKVQSDETAK